MAHHLYRTEAFVFGGVSSGEANRFLTFFTPEFGLVKAAAQGVRMLRSKLRFGLQNFSLAEVQLVRGREVWRVTNAVPKEAALRGELGVRFGRVSALVRRLLIGEVSQTFLFGLVLELFRAYQRDSLPDAEAEAMETITVMKILLHLGYFSSAGKFKDHLDAPIARIDLETFSPLKNEAITRINQSISQTQL